MRIEGTYYCPSCGHCHEIDDRFPLDGQSWWLQQCEKCSKVFRSVCESIVLHIDTNCLYVPHGSSQPKWVNRIYE